MEQMRIKNKPKCEMATITLEADHRGASICAMTYWYKVCDGSFERRKGCPFWRGVGES